MLAETRIGVLIKVRPVETSQGKKVAREMSGHPIDDHTDAGLMKCIDH